jgi:hypothetical protein
MQPLINGIARSWSQINIPFLGAPLSGVTAVHWESERMMTNNMGIGPYATSRGYGNYVFTASMTFTSEEWDNIIKSSPNGKPQEIPLFDLPILFMDDNAGLQKKVVWRSCSIMKYTNNANQGDTMIPIEVTFIVSDIIESPL